MTIYSAGLCQPTTDTQNIRVIKIEAYDQMKDTGSIGEKNFLKSTFLTILTFPKQKRYKLDDGNILGMSADSRSKSSYST